MNSSSAIAFGEVLFDLLYCNTEVEEVLGGAPANVANRLGALGTPVKLVSRIGKDELGSKLRSLLEAQGTMDLSLLQEDPTRPTGTVLVNLNEQRRVIDYDIRPEVAYDYIDCSNSELQTAVKNCSAFCFGSLAQRTETSRNSLHSLLALVPEQAIKFFDINFRKTQLSDRQLMDNVLRPSLASANILKLNTQELERLSKLLDHPSTENADTSALNLLRSIPNLKMIILTQAERGASVYASAYRSMYRVDVAAPTFVRAPNSDDIGCGDAFSAGFMHHLLKASSSWIDPHLVKAAAEYASVVAGLSFARKGGMPEIKPQEVSAGLKEMMGRSNIVSELGSIVLPRDSRDLSR